MHDTADDLFEPSLISRALLYCPSCGSTHLDPVVEALMQEVHFLCSRCGRCWDVAFGGVKRVAPTHCLGCPEHERCERTHVADHVDGTGRSVSS